MSAISFAPRTLVHQVLLVTCLTSVAALASAQSEAPTANPSGDGTPTEANGAAPPFETSAPASDVAAVAPTSAMPREDLTPPPADFGSSTPSVPTAAAPSNSTAAPASSSVSESSTPLSGTRFSDRAGVQLRLGYANPAGNAWKGAKQESFTEGVVRGQLDLTYAFSPSLVGGVYGALGIGSNGAAVKADCQGSDATCAVFVVDLGFEGEYRWMPESGVTPWVGAAVGVDVLSRSAFYDGYSQSVNLYGPALTLSGGIDIKLGGLVLGPYLSYQLGWYTSVNITATDEDSINGDLHGAAAHHWLTLGVRGGLGAGG